MPRYQCHVMEFIEACIVDIWRNSCGEENTWMMINLSKLLLTLIQHLNINTCNSLLNALSKFYLSTKDLAISLYGILLQKLFFYCTCFLSLFLSLLRNGALGVLFIGGKGGLTLFTFLLVLT